MNKLLEVYVCQLSYWLQSVIKAALIDKGITGEDLERAMNSRCSDIKYLFERTENNNEEEYVD